MEVDVRIEMVLRWFCPRCGRQHGLKDDPDVDYIDGPLSIVAKCKKCKRTYRLQPARIVLNTKELK